MFTLPKSSVKIDLSKLRDRRTALELVVDTTMINLVIINLTLIAFNWLYSYHRVQTLFAENLPAFHDWYMEWVYNEFYLIDGIFVAIFITELTVRWGIAIYRKTYHRWFYYPFVHWYDVLGCIPLSAFRSLRFLRIISLVLRLQRSGVIDLKNTYLAVKGRKYLGILIEELSDRIVINVLNDVQDQVRKGNPLVDRILSEAIRPQKKALIEWLSNRLQTVTAFSLRHYQTDFQQYVDKRINDAVYKNQEIKNLAKIPVIGPEIAKLLESAIADIVHSVLTGIAEDIAFKDNQRLYDDLSDVAIEAIIHDNKYTNDANLDAIITDITLQSIELVKESVAVQQWKIREAEERAQSGEVEPLPGPTLSSLGV